MTTTVTSAHDLGDDILLVRGEVDGVSVEARGWVSAINSHFAAAAYNADGSMKRGQAARKMTRPEQLAYAKRLLAEAVRAQQKTETSTDLGLSG